LSTERPNTARLKETLKKLREERKETLARATARHKEWQGTRKKIRAQLAAGETTVPRLAEATGLPTDEVLWHVAGMRKYGLLEEVGRDGEYPTYRLVGGDGGGGDSQDAESE
jgi:predicted transcriptional regulator